MNKDVPVAELNFPSVRPGKFTWDLSPAELANTSRKHRSDFPEYHIQLGTKNNNNNNNAICIAQIRRKQQMG